MSDDYDCPVCRLPGSDHEEMHKENEQYQLEKQRMGASMVELKAENERLMKQWSEAATQRVQTIEDLRAQVTALEQDMEAAQHLADATSRDWQLCKKQLADLQRDFGLQREYWNECEHKLAAMTTERDAYLATSCRFEEQLALAEVRLKELEKTL